MKYVLTWSGEYLDLGIVCGPVKEETAMQELKKAVKERLQELDIAKNEAAAERMYCAAEAAGPDDESDKLHVSPVGASIRYAGYDEYYQIVDYDPDKNK